MIDRELTTRDFVQIVEALAGLRPPLPLDDEQIRALAGRARIQEAMRGDIVMGQGEESTYLYFVISGQVRAADTSGDEPRLLYLHGAGSFVGELGMLHDEPRGATVDVLHDAKLALWDRETFDWLLGLDERMYNYLARMKPKYLSVLEPFQGKQWDEVTAIRTGKHPLTLVQDVIVLVLMLPLALILFLIVEAAGFEPGVLAYATIGFFVIFALLGIAYRYLEWRNDEYIVTSKRVIHIERYILYGTQRDEAPLVRIQDVTMTTGSLLQRMLDYHDLIIQTAGAGAIVFKGVRNAEEVRNKIFEEREMAMERREASDTATIRRVLSKKMGIAVRELSLPEESIGRIQLGSPEEEAGRLMTFLDYLLPRTKVVRGETITWRKHWFIWLKRTWVPLLLTLALFGATLLALRAGELPGLVAMLGLSTLIAFIAYLYRHDEWRRDAYIVTRNRIIDVKGTPFRLGGEERREGTFDAVQNITYEVSGVFRNLLNMGDVTIETAGTAATFTFCDVLRPSMVQQEVFDRMVAYHERRRQEEQEQQAGRMSEWFAQYHQLPLPEREGELP